jgi:integrase
MSSEGVSHGTSNSSHCTLCTSFNGYKFSLSDSSWILNRDVSIAVGISKEFLADRQYIGFVSTLANFAMYDSAHHAENLFFHYMALLRFANSKSIDAPLLIAYRQKIGKRREHYLYWIRILLRKWLGLGNVGVDEETVRLLDSWTLKGNIKGDAIKRQDPSSGALSDIELQGLLESSAQSYEQGLISITEFSLMALMAASGRRSVQLTSLKAKDIYFRRSKQGGRRYFVNVPRAKQRGTGFRAVFREVEVTKDLWLILNAQINYAVEVISSRLGEGLPKAYVPELPLYINEVHLSDLNSIDDLDRINQGDYLHMPTERVASLFKRTVEVVKFNSERTGRVLHLSPRRFRYTLGTRAAREGYGVLVIAELLDHSDIQNADVYTMNVPEYAARIDEAVGHQMAQYAQAFAGVLVDSKVFALRGDSRLFRPRNRNLW